MKKTLLAVIFTLVFVCIFAFGASAYENDYYYIDMPGSFAVTEDGTGVMFEKEDGTTVIIECGDADGLDFGTMSVSEQILFDNELQELYAADGLTIEYYDSYYEAGDYGDSIMSFTFQYQMNGMLIYYVEGACLVQDDMLYSLVGMYNDESDYDELDEALGTFSTKASGYTGDGSYGDYSDDEEIYVDTIDYTSNSGEASIRLPGDFIEIEATSPIESQWVSYEGDFSVAYMETENTDNESLADLSESDLRSFCNSVCASSGDAITDAVPSQYEVNGAKGVRIDATFSSSGIEAEMSIFCFATTEKIIAIYAYNYGGADESLIVNIMDTFVVNGEILENGTGFSGGSGSTFIFIGIIAVLVIIIIVLLGSNASKKKRKAAQPAPVATGYNPYGQPNQYSQPNQYGQPVNNNNNFNQGMNNNNF